MILATVCAVLYDRHGFLQKNLDVWKDNQILARLEPNRRDLTGERSVEDVESCEELFNLSRRPLPYLGSVFDPNRHPAIPNFWQRTGLPPATAEKWAFLEQHIRQSDSLNSVESRLCMWFATD